jgi:hypothetical protein
MAPLHEDVEDHFTQFSGHRHYQQRSGTRPSNDDPATIRQWGLRLFPVHNKYTTADWQWLLHEADFAVLRCRQLRPTHQMLVALPTGS